MRTQLRYGRDELARKEAGIHKVRGNIKGTARAESPVTDEEQVKKVF